MNQEHVWSNAYRSELTEQCVEVVWTHEENGGRPIDEKE